MRKDIIKLTGNKFKCISLDLDCDFAKWNKRFTIGQVYSEVQNTIKARKKYVGLLLDYGNVIYVERVQFKKI